MRWFFVRVMFLCEVVFREGTFFMWLFFRVGICS